MRRACLQIEVQGRTVVDIRTGTVLVLHCDKHTHIIPHTGFPVSMTVTRHSEQRQLQWLYYKGRSLISTVKAMVKLSIPIVSLPHHPRKNEKIVLTSVELSVMCTVQ